MFGRICEVIYELADRDLFAWLDSDGEPTEQDQDRAATVVADRLCAAARDPIIRNAQEKRQLSSLRKWLSSRGYRFVRNSEIADISLLEPGSFTFRLEVSRLDAQQNIDSQRTQESRNQLGQFSTPHELAEGIVTRAISHLPEDARIKFLDPSLGTGVFFSALRNCARDRRIEIACGIEIDPIYGGCARSLWEPEGLSVRIEDFIKFSTQKEFAESFNLLCTNPPYARHHHINPPVKTHLQRRIGEELGISVSGLSGLYVYFVLISHSLLQPGAVASWLIPSEFLFVNYGKALREYLLRKVTLLEIHQFDTEEVQFDDAFVSSCVITYRKSPPIDDSLFTFSYGGSLSHPQKSVSISNRDAALEQKWVLRQSTDDGLKTPGVALGMIFDIKRGVATGANGFFIVDEAIIRKYSIPRHCLRPLLPSSRYLDKPIIESDEEGLPRVSRLRFLLDCTESPDVVRVIYPGLWQYLELGVKEGIPNGYLCASREVWYFQEKRPPAPFVATYMGRSNGRTESPFKFYLNLSRAVVTNVFLNLYPKRFFQALLEQERDRCFELLSVLNSIEINHMIDEGRSYGGGLHKIEPRELANVRLPSLPAWLEIGDRGDGVQMALI